jgi:NAD(P)-dependent dehydrogenase (short-subunit alcohol dehydrogenase family)
VPRLAGRVVIVAAKAADAARVLAEDGAAVVLVGADAGAGDLVAEIELAGGRAAVFAGDLGDETDRAALAEMVDELFSPRDA